MTGAIGPKKVLSIRWFTKILLLGLFISAGYSPLLYAFSLGEIRVKGGSESQFIAEIPLLSEEGVTVGIGDDKDYSRLGLPRPEFADNLNVELVPDPTDPSKKLVYVVSKEPILNPSFNLIVRATMGSGTILKNYFIALDFSKSLTLDLPEKGEPEKIQESKAEIPEPPPPPEQPTPEAMEPESRSGVEKPIMVIPAEPEVKSQTAETPTKPEPTPKPTAVESAAAAPLSLEPVSIRKGDTLFRMAGKFRKSGIDRERIVMALWQLNPDSFIQGNLHGLKPGATLNLDGVIESAKRLDRGQAQAVINTQWKEWTESAGFTKPYAKKERPVSLAESPLPVETDWAASDVRDRFHLWKHQRESRDLDGLMQLYEPQFRSEGKDLAALKEEIKSDWDKSPSGSKVEYRNIRFRQVEDGTEVSFLETEGENPEGAGTFRSLHFSKDENEWKIKEEFSEQESPGQASSNPYVIHVASFKRPETSLKLVNELRGKGFNAFWVGVDLGDKGRWYRVLIDRFSSPKAARRFADKMLADKTSDFARVFKLPYAIRLSSNATKEEAIETVKRSKEAGVSPYLLVFEEGDDLRFQILVGSYSTQEEAEKDVAPLRENNLTGEVVLP